MLVTREVSLNLASHPIRNRRLFFLTVIILVIFLMLVTFLGGRLFLKYREKTEEAKTSLAETLSAIRTAQGAEQQFSKNILETRKRYKEKLDLINSIILRKSFSWVKFFNDLENSLPDSSYIIFMAPVLRGDSRMEVRFKVASRNLGDLLKFLNNLKAMKFDQIRVESEEKDEKGFLNSEISLSYERDI